MSETRTLHGIGIGRQLAVGPVLRMPDPLPAPSDTVSELTAAEETERVNVSLAAVAADLMARGERAGGTARDVLEAQAMMAQDPTLKASIADLLAKGKTAEMAVWTAFGGFRDMLIGLGGYMAERATDLDDVSGRVLAHLQGVPAPGVPDSETPFVLVARDLAPADTALLNLDKVMALVTSDGGPTAHTAILARDKAIVAVVGVAGAQELADGTTVIVDASTGIVTANPDRASVARAEDARDARRSAAAAPITDGALADGTAVPLLANLGSAGGIQAALAAGAEGVGLFRTEFLFLDATSAPTVVEQREKYRELLAAFPGRKVVVRLLDAGADKPLAFLNSAREENPALGVRGLRALRANEDILREQLTALAEADGDTESDLWVMAPMVATVEETRYFTALAHELGLRTVGVMVEVPSAAIGAANILQHAAFASIGTNDLTQYTMAADRMLGSVSNLQDPWHPSVLHLVKMVGDAGADLGKPVGICGEAAADPLLAVVLVGLGATTLSMSPAALADVRAELRGHTREEARALALVALAADDAADARTAVRAAINNRTPHTTQKEEHSS
ncbi:phosphoenolpyruvate--protein phosphotransferase [Klugiella xanthotipulae]|uniref:Phosphoenolpyruvate-protein phosphotransferase n=1 Tax=Klugiella xanthotipulae TaxID=244735 RepID=A0A543I595_9MICO|nr:phosphoenolpyruvate--protein phosphotransferase [Klugiella xanthotipulae]TQM65749.1 phosphoenolpyruvate--protein phosphotransferase [Klugiella xanthotipulae]